MKGKKDIGYDHILCKNSKISVVKVKDLYGLGTNRKKPPETCCKMVMQELPC